METPGILILNKTYGRVGHMLKYKFIPYNRDIAVSYIPYKSKYSFNKHKYDLYIVALCESGVFTIKKVIGPTDSIMSFCMYKLHCHSLIYENMVEPTDLTGKSDRAEMLADPTVSAYEDRTVGYDIFTIDNADTKDYDDAFSIDGDTISVYISCVCYFMEIYDAWPLMTGAVSNIYLPESRYSMLCDTILKASNLNKGNKTLALTMDYSMKTQSYDFKICKVAVSENYVYESIATGESRNENYSKIEKLVEPHTNCRCPKKTVEFLMRLMCFKAGEVLYRNKCGIFRTINEPLENFIPSNKYITYEEYDVSCAATCGVPYAHITSPMRRLVDILNQNEIIRLITPIIYGKADHRASPTENAGFAENINLDKINKDSRAIKRIQNEAALLSIYDTIKDKTFKGKIIDAEDAEAGIYIYTVFLYDLYLIAPYKTCKNLSGEHYFKLHKFESGANFRRKIRLSIVPCAGEGAGGNADSKDLD